MPAKCRVTPLAEADLEAIWFYTSKKWSPAQADSYVGDIIQACEDLAAGMKKGRDIAELRAGYWKYSVGSHFLFYRFEGDALEITRILHQRMDTDQHL